LNDAFISALYQVIISFRQLCDAFGSSRKQKQQQQEKEYCPAPFFYFLSKILHRSDPPVDNQLHKLQISPHQRSAHNRLPSAPGSKAAGRRLHGKDSFPCTFPPLPLPDSLPPPQRNRLCPAQSS